MRSGKLKCEKPPKYCYFRKGRWVYYPSIPGEKRKEIPLNDCGKLLKENTPCSTLYQAIDNLTAPIANTIEKLLNLYLESEHVKDLSENTLNGYLIYKKTIIKIPMKNGKTFGEMPYEMVTPGVIKSYFDKRSLQGVTTGANREIELLSAAYNWAYERDKATKNPCKGVRHNSEKARKKYIDDIEYNSLLKLSKGSALYFAIEITYLCRARGIEAWNLTIDHIDDAKGVYIARSKGSNSEWTLWTPRLRNVINEALTYREEIINHLRSKKIAIPQNNFLILNRKGVPYTKNGRDTAWQRVYQKLVESGHASMEKHKRFTFHDIKAKGVSDHENHESGHKSDRAKAVYMRKVKEVIATK